MAIEIDIRIIGETTHQVVQELGQFASHLTAGLVVASPPANAPDTPEPQAPAAADANGGGKPATTGKRGAKAAKPDDATVAAPKVDRAAIIDGLTKIYSKGDEDTRQAITKFRDGQGADRLRDLKDDALPAAAELLAELKLAAEAPAV